MRTTNEHRLPRSRPELEWIGKTVHFFNNHNVVCPAVVIGISRNYGDEGTSGPWKHGDPEPDLLLRVLGSASFDSKTGETSVRDYTASVPFTADENGEPLRWGWPS